MARIEFSKDERTQMVSKLQKYFSDEMDQTLGQFEAEFLLDFIAKELGAFYYNRGLLDAQAVLAQRVELIVEAIDELEQPTSFMKQTE